MGKGLTEMLATLPKAERAKCEVYRVLADPQPDTMAELYQYLLTHGYKVGTYVMMLDADTPNNVIVGLAKAYKDYGNTKVDVPLHAMFAFAPAVAVKLIYLTIHLEQQKLSHPGDPRDEAWLGFLRDERDPDSASTWFPTRWIHANNADSGSWRQPAVADSKARSTEPWAIPPPAKLEAVLPCDGGDTLGGLLDLLYFQWLNMEKVHYGDDWTKQDFDDLLQKSETPNWQTSFREELKVSLNKLMRDRKLIQ